MENESKSKTPMIIVGVIIAVLVLGGGGFLLLNSTENSSQSTSSTTTTTTSNPTPGDTSENVQVISITGANYKFNPDEIRVKVGQPVRVELKVDDMKHDFVIDALNVKSSTGEEGETVVVEFTPTETGIFEFYCSVSDHKEMGMVGNLIVE